MPADALQKPRDSSCCCLSGVCLLALEVLDSIRGREKPMNEFLPSDINHWRTRYYGTYSSLLALQWTVSPWGPGHPGSNPLLSRCPLAGLPSRLPSPLPSCPLTPICLKGLCANPLGETQKGNSKLSQNSYFFFPNRITAACYNHSNQNYLNLSSLYVCNGI